MTSQSRFGRRWLLAASVVLAMAVVPEYLTSASAQYTVTNLVSNLSGVAPTTDTHLVNAWGLTSSSTSPF